MPHSSRSARIAAPRSVARQTPASRPDRLLSCTAARHQHTKYKPTTVHNESHFRIFCQLFSILMSYRGVQTQKITRGKTSVGRYTLIDCGPSAHSMPSRSVGLPHSTTITSLSGTNRSVCVLETATAYCEVRTQPVISALLTSE